MKFVLVAVVILVVILGRRLYLAGRARQVAPPPPPPLRVPPELRRGDAGTWIVFASRGDATVADGLEDVEPARPVVRIDPAREPHLASGLRVRSTPAALLCRADGTVEARLDGGDAIRRYVTDRSATA